MRHVPLIRLVPLAAASGTRGFSEGGTGTTGPVLSLDRFRAVVFDTDGVITDTARVHAAAWKRVFDAFLQARADRLGEKFHPFDVRWDYLRYVDGRPRLDGVRSFLDSRGIALSAGDPADSPERETERALGARKDTYFLDQLWRYGVAAFPSTVALVRELRRHGARTAAVSASRNCAQVLAAAGVAELFDVRVDGVDAARLGLAGKPDPALFLEAVRRLGVAPGRAAVVEDALAGVEAARSGDFGLVIGVDRVGQGDALHTHGADVVVTDLAEVSVVGAVGRVP